MAKSRSQPDVLILGSHPCCSLAGALLHEHKITSFIASIPGKPIARSTGAGESQVLRASQIHHALKKLPGLTPVSGLRFLADEPATWSEYIANKTVGCIGEFSTIQKAMVEQARRARSR